MLLNKFSSQSINTPFFIYPLRTRKIVFENCKRTYFQNAGKQLQPTKRNKFQSSRDPKEFRIRQIIFGILSCCGATYAVANYDVVPITGRRRVLPISERYEMKLGQETYEEMLRQYGQRIYPANHQYTRWVKSVGSRIVKVSGLEHYDWQFHVVDHPSANCFVIPGGKVFLFTGMVPFFDTDDSLAAVLGHEIGHVVARHSAEKQASTILMRFIYPLISIFFSIDPGLTRIGGSLAVDLPFSRRCETEADYIGMILMARACYDPAAAIHMWEKFEKMEKTSKVLMYFSTHPTNENRAKHSQKWLEDANKEKEKYCPAKSFSFF